MIGKKILLYNFGIAISILVCTLFIDEGNTMFFAGKRPGNLGVQEGKLAGCPSSPNCVSSFEDGTHFISPFSFEGEGDVFFDSFIRVLDEMKSARVIEKKKTYIYAEFTSSVFGFVDDIEFLLDNDKKVVHIRSASRLGYSDFGVNRKRVEEVRKRLNDLNK